MDFSNLSDRDLYNLWLNKATLNPADRTAVIQEYNTRNASGNFNPNRSTVQPTSTPVQVNVPDPTVNDVPPASARYTRPDTVVPAQVQQDIVAQQMSQAQAEQDAQNIPPDAVDGGLELFDDWVKTVPPEQIAKYEAAEQPLPEQVPAKEPAANNRVFSVPAQKPAGMPSRVWEQLNPSSSTETTVDSHVVPERELESAKNPYLGPTVQDPKSYTLNNMNRLQPDDIGIVHNGQKYKLTPDEMNQWMEDNVLPPEVSPEQSKEDKEDKAKKSEERKQKIKDTVNKLSESNRLSDGAASAATGAASMLADAANFGGSIDPSGESTYAREQADIQAKQAALMDARRQAADRIWNRDLKSEADKKAAAGAAAENAQHIANTAAGESTVGQRGVKAADYNYEEQRADNARKEGTELSKDANQYQMAAIQRQSDAAGIDYDYNRQRGINNAATRLNMGNNAAAGTTKSNTGTTPMPGETPDKKPVEEETKQEEAVPNTPETTPNTTPAPAPNTQGGENKNQEKTPVPQPQSTNKTVNNINPTDEAIKQREAARVGTSTPQATTVNTDENARKNAGATGDVAAQASSPNSVSSRQKAYADALHRWAYNVSKKSDAEHNLASTQELERWQRQIEQTGQEAINARMTGLPKFNINDYSPENVDKVWKYVQRIQGGN